MLIVARREEENHIGLEHFLKLVLTIAVGQKHLLQDLKDQLKCLSDDDVGFAEDLALLLPIDPLIKRLVDDLKGELGPQYRHVLAALLSVHL